MNLSHYIQRLQQELITTAEAGGDDATRELAERLTSSLESGSRLMLLEALSAAAGEITSELAPGSVDVRLRGRDPEFVVTLPPAAQSFDEPDGASSHQFAAAAPEPGDGSTARMTLRLPEPLKVRIEEVAAREGLSVNAWMVRALAASLDPPDERRTRRRSPPGAQRYTGWVR